MKKTLVIIALLVSTTIVSAQRKTPNFYLGLGTGINNPIGLLGVRAEARVAPKVLLDLGAGIGSWGYKTTVGLMYEPKHERGFCPKISYARASGIDSLLITAEVTSAGVTSIKQVGLQLHPVNLLNIGTQYQWITRKELRLFLEFGYSISLTSNTFELRDKRNTLSDKDKAVYSAINPGGIILAFGISFPL